MSTAQAAPWSVGDRVVLRRPDNPRHPRRGRVGTVLRTRWFAEEVRRGQVVATAFWTVVVRFDPVEKTDAFETLGVGSDWMVFDGELAKVETKGGKTP